MNRAQEEHQELISELDRDFFHSMLLDRDRSQGSDPNHQIELYFCKEFFPVLLPGLENLALEVERYMREGKHIDYRIRSRFNPCRWLAQYLMRNNPKYGADPQITSDYNNQTFVEAAKRTLDHK